MSRFRACSSIVVLLFLFVGVVFAQNISVAPRITEAIDESRLVVLHGNTHPMAQAQFDRGPAPASLPMERMLLVLTRSSQQATALQGLLDAQQDKSSANYHKWLAPEQFGEQFGTADQDIHLVQSWLQSHGFQVNQVAKGKTVIEFSGTAGQVRDAFHTEIHKFAVNGEDHWANASDPQIPAALEPVLAGVATLHNFRAKPLVSISPKWPKVPTPGGGTRPEYDETDGTHALTPADYAVIYNIKPLYKEGINGNGVTIGVLGVAPILAEDIADFRTVFGLSQNAPQFLVNGTTPDYFQFELEGSGPDTEGTLDVSWSGAIAPGATIKFISAASTDTTDGLTLAEEYAVDSNMADIITESFSNCESELTAAQAQQITAVREQAAAQGITYVVASGDWGPYTCYPALDSGIGPISVNALASTPYTVAVGGTEFNPTTDNGNLYWATKNGTSLSSALSYIGENVWNDSCDAAQCGADNVTVGAGGGGASQLFSKPTWQAGVNGIPNDGKRDVPDLSLTASPKEAPYLLCYWNSCTGGHVTANSFLPVGGTSASAPSFAGIMALINQKMKSRQGAANYVLYKLAASQTYSKCTGSNLKSPPVSACIFNDITVGNNAIPGEPEYGTAKPLYTATPGYDLATGLGSLNVANLVNNWDSVSFNPTNTSLSLTPTNLTHGTAASVQSLVAPQSGSGTPTGAISLVTAGGAGYGSFPLADGVANSALTSLPGGTYSVQAHYSGDTQFAASDSAPVSVTVASEPSITTVGAMAPFYIPNAFYTSGSYGSISVWLSAEVAGLSGQGIPTGKVTFTDNGGPISEGTGFVNEEGKAISTNSVIAFTPGRHSIVASYQGDVSFQSSVSPPVTISITKAPTTLSIQPSLTQVPSGQSVTLTATVESGNNQAGNIETGTVAFFLNGSPLVNLPVTYSFDFNTQLQVGVATYTTSKLPDGTDTITATYGGDSNYLGSTAQPVGVKVGTTAPACKVTNFTADPNPISVFDPPAVTTISVIAPCKFDVRVGSPGGTLLGSGSGTFSITTTAPVQNDEAFYLQTQGNKTSADTLAKLTVGVQAGTAPCVVFSFSATPNPIVSATGGGATTITAVASCAFDVRIGSANGSLLGTATDGLLVSTPNNVTNGMEYFLQPPGDKHASDTLATLTIPVVAPTSP